MYTWTKTAIRLILRSQIPIRLGHSKQVPIPLRQRNGLNRGMPANRRVSITNQGKNIGTQNRISTKEVLISRHTNGTLPISYNNKFIQILYVSISDQREQASNYFPNILASLKKIETTSLPETNNSAIPSENISSSTAATSSTPKTPTVTTGQKNALNRAKQYLRTMPFSYTGLIEQLEYEQYSHDDAVYAADNCGANWSEQAAKKAKSYLNTMAFSRKGLIEQLQYEGYTYEQAVYATDNCGADWNEQAAKKAQSYLDIMSFSRQGLIDQLQFEGYTYEQAVYGVNQVGL